MTVRKAWIVDVGTAVTLTLASFWTYGYVASEEPFVSFDSYQAVIALSFPPAIGVTLLLWSVDVARSVIKGGESPGRLAIVAVAALPCVLMCVSTMLKYCADMTRFDCGLF